MKLGTESIGVALKSLGIQLEHGITGTKIAPTLKAPLSLWQQDPLE